MIITQVLRERNPEAFRLLSETIVRFRDVGKDYRKFNKLNQTTFFVYARLYINNILKIAPSYSSYVQS